MEKNLPEEAEKNIQLYRYSMKYAPFFRNIDREQVGYFLLTYVIPFCFGLVNFAVGYFMGEEFDGSILYMIYLIINATSTWFGGVVGGLITVLVTVSGNLYIGHLRTESGITPILLVQSSTFILSAVFLSYLISWAKRHKEIEVLKEKERVYARTFKDVYEEYTKALNEIKARDRFLSIASHELKTPLTSMLLKLSDILNRIKNVSLARFSIPELMRVLQNAQDQVKWLTAMINDLLNISLMTTGRMNLSRQKMDLVKITRTVKESFSEVLKREKYSIRIDASSAVFGNWDKTRIEQAITNLFSNAIKYGRNKPIDIQIFSHGDVAKFVIRDRGIGISREDQKIIFKPFERPKSVAGYKKGLGVGLYLTDMIVKSHGGHIKVESVSGKGTTFTLELPVK